MALFVALLTAVPAQAKRAGKCHSHACKVRVASKKCSQTRPRWCVEHAILLRGLTGWQAAWMRRIPSCESRWNPYARNPSGSSGLFQFMPGTWAGTPYGRRSIWSARHQALAAAWMLAQGRSREWVCR